MSQPDILDDNRTYTGHVKGSRRKLLPWWIKVFLWLFLVMSLFIPVGMIVSIFNPEISIALYGMEAHSFSSLEGLFLVVLFLIKGVTAYGLWWEKKWAVDLGTVDAILGILVCTYMMFVRPSIVGDRTLNLRLELVGLIPFLIKLRKIRPEWMRLGE